MRKFRVRWARVAAVVLAITCVVLANGRREQARRLAAEEAARVAEEERMKVIYKELRECRLLIHGRETDEVRIGCACTSGRMVLDSASTKLPEILALEDAANDDWKNIQDAQRAGR